MVPLRPAVRMQATHMQQRELGEAWSEHSVRLRDRIQLKMTVRGKTPS